MFRAEVFVAYVFWLFPGVPIPSHWHALDVLTPCCVDGAALARVIIPIIITDRIFLFIAVVFKCGGLYGGHRVKNHCRTGVRIIVGHTIIRACTLITLQSCFYSVW